MKHGGSSLPCIDKLCSVQEWCVHLPPAFVAVARDGP